MVVGGGVSGLTAARELQRRGYSALVLESASELGGRVRTEHWADARIELGAHVVTPAYTRTLELVDEMGLREHLVRVEHAFRTGVRRESRWHYVDYADPPSLRGFSAIAWRDKLSILTGTLPAILRSRSLRYGDIATAAALDAKSAADAFRADAFRYYLAPLYEAFFGYTEEQLSYAVMALATLSRDRPLTFAPGMGALPEALAVGLEVKTHTSVHGVRSQDGGVEIVLRGSRDEPGPVRGRAVILATPAAETLRLWPDAPAPAEKLLATFSYTRADRVYLRTRSPYTPTAPDGKPLHMQLIPAADRDGDLMVLIEFMHQRADDGGLVYAEAAAGSGADRMDDETLVERLESEVLALHPELRGEVTARRVVRTEPMTPIFPPGRGRELATLRDAIPPSSVELAGDYLHAPWIEGAVVSGERAAARVDAYLSGSG